MDSIMKMDVVTSNGIPFRVVYLPAGTPSEHYPAEMSDGGETRSRVEFYDRRYDHTSDGQFTGGRYFAQDIADRDQGVALNLYGGEDDWTIDGTIMHLIGQWLVWGIRYAD